MLRTKISGAHVCFNDNAHPMAFPTTFSEYKPLVDLATCLIPTVDRNSECQAKMAVTLGYVHFSQ